MGEEEDEFDAMKVSIEKEKANRVEFSVDGITVPFANAIRRYVMSHVPVLAIEHVTFYDNTSWIFDEYIAHRLGMLPITTPAKLPDNVEINFSIDETGPKVVYSKDIKSSDKEIHAAREKIPILTLNENQHLRLEARVVKGIGTKHAKFQSGLASYELKDEGKFRFIVESFYQMEPSDVLLRGCAILEDEVSEIIKQLKKEAKK